MTGSAILAGGDPDPTRASKPGEHVGARSLGGAGVIQQQLVVCLTIG